MHLGQVLVIEESSYGYSESFDKVYHVIYLMQKQIYFLRNLHVYPHYTIKLSNLKQLEMKASNENASISRYSINQSHVNQFLTIINYGTIEWTYEIETIYNKIQFKALRHKLNTSSRIDEKRNTTQISFGICNHSYKQYIMSNGLPKPNLLSGSIDTVIKTAMRNISSLCVSLATSQYIPIDTYGNEFRNKQFANNISPDNILEGFTIATHNWNTLLNRHTDKNNCRSTGYNGVIGISSCDHNDRTILLGYGKNVCARYICRQQRYVYNATLMM